MSQKNNATTAGAAVANRPVSLDNWRSRNWGIDSAPATVVNPDAPLHSLAAWCWGEAAGIYDLLRGCASADVELDWIASPLVTMLSCRMESLVAMLEHIGDVTADAERNARKGG